MKENEELVAATIKASRKARAGLNLIENKLLLAMISFIEPNDREFTPIILHTQEIGQMININIDGGSGMARLKKSILSVSNMTIVIDSPCGICIPGHWFSHVDYDSWCGRYRFCLDNTVFPFLRELRFAYTNAQIQYAMLLSSIHAFNLYDLLINHLEEGTTERSIQDLRTLLHCEGKYSRFQIFNWNVIKSSVAQINERTNLSVSYIVNKEGKYAETLSFFMKAK